MLHTLTLLRQLKAHEFTSGEAIARQLNISRSAVSGALTRSVDYGVELERRHGVGYKLTQTLEWLDHDQISRQLTPHSPFKLQLTDEIDSTNRALRQDNAAPGTVLAAEWQNAGRGRLGRQWVGSLGGSLLFSLVWRFSGGMTRLAGLSLAVGIALTRALEKKGYAGMGLKWPNDVLCAKGKLAGILIELSGDALGPADAVIGIGLNLRLSDAERLNADHAADLSDCPGPVPDRNALLAAILNELADILPRFDQDGFAPLRAEWEARHLWQGEQARLISPDGKENRGRIIGVAEDGALRMAGEDGLKIAYAGDVSLRRENAS
ncbi:biotin--[acetyl-CoA-carboxylase] ligase [Iodobacter sp. LRB]|uniref:biotin--[acetyl-CoA-carboxylase] ligase n=1 Tax=unclassified Iodobacter TaxID=235634 RepID=UPI000C0FEACD|nr:biotin--[acetyl-CoA-carboxylase] ligase [Iodobacter sp. BJB302]PHV01840.1 biotin--[acetyl-CoA-carboxylase] ligase [Iodobacter sp. BJB302]